VKVRTRLFWSAAAPTSDDASDSVLLAIVAVSVVCVEEAEEVEVVDLREPTARRNLSRMAISVVFSWFIETFVGAYASYFVFRECVREVGNSWLNFKGGRKGF
jgi:hypothetical protein